VSQGIHGTEIRAVHGAEPEWLTAKEAAAYLKVKTRTIQLWVRQRKVRGYALSGIKRRVWRFRKADFDSMLLAQDVSVLSSDSPSVLVMKGEGK
jgi:excisionase family DNA binding protein